MLTSTLPRHLAIGVVALVALFALTMSVDPYSNLQIATIAYFSCAAAGLSMLVGLTGQISLGHGAFMAIGAYAAALLGRDGSGLLVMLLAAVVAAALAGALVGGAAARLHGPYLAGATLAIAVGLPALANYRPLAGWLGGEYGIAVPISPPPFGDGFPLERWQAWVSGVAAVITFVLLANLTSSRVGRNLRAVRDDEAAAALCGVRNGRQRVLGFVVSAACAGLAGGLLTFVSSLTAPGAFHLSLSLSLLAAVVLGGLGSLAGAVLGSVVLVLLPTWSSDLAETLGLSSDVYGNFPLALYGVVLIVVMLAFPAGLSGLPRRLRAALRSTRNTTRSYS